MTLQEMGRVSHRARMILLPTRHRTGPEEAHNLKAYGATVRVWIKRFKAAGLTELHGQERSGRSPRSTDQIKDSIMQMIQEDPSPHGDLVASWTELMLLLAAISKGGARLSPSTLGVPLHELGLRRDRSRLAIPEKADPEKTSKQWAMARRVQDAGSGAAISCAGGSRIYLLSLLPSVWH